MNYTADDIIFNRNAGRQDYRTWNRKKGEYDYKDVAFHTFSTKDGKYITKQDCDGYSYWYDVTDNYHMGDTAYDYLFVTDAGDKEYVVKALNKVLAKQSD